MAGTAVVPPGRTAARPVDAPPGGPGTVPAETPSALLGDMGDDRADSPAEGTGPAGAGQRRIEPFGGPGRALLGAARGVLWWFNSVLGGKDYERYVAHLRRKHPGCPIPSEREYWRERHAEADRNPANRCC